jgi:hypothetical protein
MNNETMMALRMTSTRIPAALATVAKIRSPTDDDRRCGRTEEIAARADWDTEFSRNAEVG